jgi:hypothetical protein
MGTLAPERKPTVAADPECPDSFIQLVWRLLGDPPRIRQLGVIVTYLCAALASIILLVLAVTSAIGGAVPPYVVPGFIGATSLITWIVTWISKKVKGQRGG